MSLHPDGNRTSDSGNRRGPGEQAAAATVAKWHVIWNEHSGSAERAQTVRRRLERTPRTTVSRLNGSQTPRELARQAAESGAHCVVVAGGDGTVKAVVEGLMDAACDTILGVIPLGTGNDFCRNAGIPLDPDQACELLHTGVAQPTDVIRGQTPTQTFHYINMATGGNSGLHTDVITDDLKQFWGPLTYVRGVVNALTDLHAWHVQLVIDGETLPPERILNVFLANGRVSGGGLPVAPDAKLDDGLVDVIVVRDCSPVDMAALATQYVLSDYRNNEHIVFRQAKVVSIHAEPPLTISVDGDVVTDQPTTFRVIAGGVKVIRPIPS